MVDGASDIVLFGDNGRGLKCAIVGAILDLLRDLHPNPRLPNTIGVVYYQILLYLGSTKIIPPVVLFSTISCRSKFGQFFVTRFDA